MGLRVFIQILYGFLQRFAKGPTHGFYGFGDFRITVMSFRGPSGFRVWPLGRSLRAWKPLHVTLEILWGIL